MSKTISKTHKKEKKDTDQLKINQTVLRKFCEDVGKKDVLALNEPELIKEFLTYTQIHDEYMKNASAYNMASIIKSFSTWYEDNKKEPEICNSIKNRDVYYVDLGAYNLKYEEGFMHPCVVIKKHNSQVLVIPGSTKKYGIDNNMILDIEAGDGFTKNTGLMLDQIRIVSSTRIVKKKLGRVKEETFDLILDKIIEKFLGKKRHEIDLLKAQLKESQKEIDKYKSMISELEEQIHLLNLEVAGEK